MSIFGDNDMPPGLIPGCPSGIGFFNASKYSIHTGNVLLLTLYVIGCRSKKQ